MRWFRKQPDGYSASPAEWNHLLKLRDNAEAEAANAQALAQQHFDALLQEAGRTKRYEDALRQIRLPRSKRVGKRTAPDVARRAMDGIDLYG